MSQSLLNTKALSAASKGDVGTLKSLKDQLSLSDCADKFGATPVHYAARLGKVDVIKWLVQSAGLSANKSANNGATPAHDSAATGKLDCLQWLIHSGGCKADARDSCGATPLHLGRWAGLVELYILRNWSFVSGVAARFGHMPIAVWLVESEGVSVSEKAQNGVTPVHLAAAKGSINCLRWMTQHDKRYCFACTCSLYNLFYVDNNNIVMHACCPSSVNKRADNGTTPVYFAAQEGRLDCLQYLVTQASTVYTPGSCVCIVACIMDFALQLCMDEIDDVCIIILLYRLMLTTV